MTALEPAGSQALPVAAMVAEEPGRPSVLQPATITLPHPTATQALVAVHLAGVNYWDVMQRRGQVPLPPSRVPGVEGVGTVIECGPDAPAALLGRRVAWSKVKGSYADHVLADAEWLVEVPDSVPDEVAAGVLMQGVTAQYLADDTCPLAAGDSAVVFAAAGGVGTLLTQSLRRRGVRVVGVVGSKAKAPVARAAGTADVVVDGPELVERIRSLEPDGVAGVFDANGGPDAGRGFDLLRRRGMLVLYGTAGGPLPVLDTARMGDGSLYLTRASGHDYAATASEWRHRAELVMSRASGGELRVHVGEIAPLTEAARLHTAMETRASTGKLLLRAGA